MSGISINEYSAYPPQIEKNARSQSEWNGLWSAEWETSEGQTFIQTQTQTENVINQNHYSIQLFFAHNPKEISTYIRNVNLMLLVIDG